MEYEYKYLFLYVLILVILALGIKDKSKYKLELKCKYSQFAAYSIFLDLFHLAFHKNRFRTYPFDCTRNHILYSP